MADDIDKDYFNSLSLLLEKTEKGEEDLENLEAGIDFAIKYILYIKQDVFSESVNKLLVELRVILQNIRPRKAESSNQLYSIYKKTPKTSNSRFPIIRYSSEACRDFITSLA